jgi:hypothetical protein
LIEREGRLSKGVERKGPSYGRDPLVVIALAFSVNGTAPRRSSSRFRSDRQISRPDFQGRRAGARSHCTVSPTSSVLSPKLALHPKSTIQILNPPKISKSAPTTTVTSHSRIHHFYHFQPQQQRLNSATSSSFITLSALNCDHVVAHLPSYANVDAMQAKQWFSPLVADQQKVASKFHPFRHSVRSSERALATCCFVA